MTRKRTDTFAVATVTRNPHRLDRWITYYRKLGAERLYVCVEETPEAVEECKKHQGFVVTTHSKANANPYETIIDRQERHVNWALDDCQRSGIQWLVHCDDDELLFFGVEFARIVAECPDEATCIVIPNVEAVPEDEMYVFSFERLADQLHQCLSLLPSSAGPTSHQSPCFALTMMDTCAPPPLRVEPQSPRRACG